MSWLKCGKWRAFIALAGLLALLTFMVLIPLSASAYAGVSGVPQAMPTVDVTATMTALQEEQLILQNKQLQQGSDRGFGTWLWNNAAAIVASFLSTLVVVGGALIGFWQWRMNRDDIRTKELINRQEAQDKELRDRQIAQDKDLRAQAEERFRASVTALGDEKESVQIGGAILLRSFLNTEDEEIYERYYTQIFDLAVAYLRLLRTPPPSNGLDSTSSSLGESDTPLPITPLRQALSVVFKEAFPFARNQNKVDPQSLDATDIQLDSTYLRWTDLKQVWMPRASLRKVDLVRANLTGAYLNRADLREAQLNGADLTGANLSRADLSEADLKGASLKGAKLRRARLTRVKLWKADLSLVKQWGDEFRKVDLSGADLREADLSWTDPSWAYLEKLGLEIALSLEGTDLRGVTGLTREQLLACKAKGAIIDEDTTTTSPQPNIPPSTTSQHTYDQTPLTQASPPPPDINGTSASVPQQSNAVQTSAAAPTQVVALPVNTDGSDSTSESTHT